MVIPGEILLKNYSNIFYCMQNHFLVRVGIKKLTSYHRPRDKTSVNTV